MRRVVAMLVAAVTLTAAAANAQERPRTLVMPFENVTREGRIFWLGEASAVLLADDLNALGGRAITREERRAAFERLQVPPAATLTEATIIRLGQLVGATEVVIGTLELDDESLVVKARTIALETGRIQQTIVEHGPIPELFSTFERIARRLVPSSAVSSEDIQRTQPSVAAFENYIKGLLAGTPDTAIHYLTLALQTQPTFDRARLALWDVYAEQDAHDRALIAVQAIPATSPWYRRARFLTGLSQLNLKKNDEAYASFKAVSDQEMSAAALNNLGVVQLRRGATPQTGQPEYFFNRAAEADGTDPDYFFNLGYAYWLQRDTQAAIYWLREAVRRDPADGDAHFVLGTALAAAGNGREATREKELAHRLSSTYADWEKRPAAEVVPKGLERVKTGVELPHHGGIDAVSNSSQRDQRELAQFYLDRAERLFDQESDGDAMSELNRALFLSPYLAEAHLLVGRIQLRGGHPQEAIEALKISIWSSETVEAHVALAEAYLAAKDEPAAKAEASRALAIDPASVDAKRILGSIND
ncbi:MAG TPA: tetratricopeptide repeat protein [Vicinamibacterales bacterium]|nr:tetratricopeptide repeat protein [Vicinamibacterales bacterium]